MKCPLLCIAKPLEVTHIEPTEVDCLHEECAWWVENIGECVIKVAIVGLGALGAELEAIKNKMPHEEQFRR